MRSRGRPASPRNVWSFEDAQSPLPTSALLDTSFVVEALNPQQPLHEPAIDYLVRLATHDVPIVFSAMLELELAEVAFQLALKERYPRDWRRFRHDGRARRRASRLMGEVSAAWGAVLGYFEYTRVEIDIVNADVARLMSAHGLASYDAVHAATMYVANAAAIVTTDTGFAALPAGDVSIVIDSSRVASCRKIRAGR